MIIKRTFKYRLKPNRKQQNLFFQFAGARRWVFNRGLAQRKEAFEKEGRTISLFDQNKELTVLKEQEETKWLSEIHSQVLQQSLHDLDGAYQNFFRRIKEGTTPGFPRFKCKGEKDSFRFPQGVKTSGDKAWLPKIGWVRFKKSREIQGDIKQTTVILEGGYWYACFSCEIEKEIIPIFTKNLLALDLGIESYATLCASNHEWAEGNPSFLRKDLEHLRYLNKQLSKKTRGSRNYSKAKAKLQMFHAKVRNRRQDFLHKLSTQLIKSHDAVAVESLNVKSMLMNACKSMARAISDAGWRSFLEMLKYKCEDLGKRFVEVDKFFPSSQLCSSCGNKKKISLSERVYKCECCGLEIHRDINAARNIRAAGMSVLKACGAACVSGSNEAGILRL